MMAVILEDAADDIESGRPYVYAILDMRRDPLWIRSELERRK